MSETSETPSSAGVNATVATALVLLTLALLASTAAVTAQAQAADAAEPSAMQAAAVTLPAFFNGLTLGFSFDGYYQYDSNAPAPTSTLATATTPSKASLPAGNVPTRSYDIYHNQMTVSLAELELKKSGKEASLLIDFDFGTEADINAAVPQTDGSNAVADPSSKNIGQAYVTYTPTEVAGLTIDFGKVYTHLGLESAKAKDNWQYSRSILYAYGVPTWHTGLHVGYDLVAERLTAGLYVYNGWNATSDNNNGKILGASVRYAPNSKFNIVYNFIGGPQQDSSDGDIETLHEVYFTWTISDKIALSGDAIDGTETHASVPPSVSTTPTAVEWRAAMITLKYQMSSDWYFSPRAELFSDLKGHIFNVAPQTLQSYTLTSAWALSEGLETRLEISQQTTDGPAAAQLFSKSDGSKTSSQTTALVAMLYAM